MAAPNFYKRNASRYFCFGRQHYTTQEDIDANDWPQELLGQLDEDQTQWDYESAKDYLLEELKKAGYWEPEGRYDRLDYETSYGSGYVAKTVREINYAGANFYITVKVRENSGYYSGSCLDYDISITGDNWENGDFDLCDDYTDETYLEEQDIIDADCCGNPGLSKLQAKNIIKRLNKELLAIIEELELIFSRCCQDELYLEWCATYCGFAGEAGYGKYSKHLYEEREAA